MTRKLIAYLLGLSAALLASYHVAGKRTETLPSQKQGRPASNCLPVTSTSHEGNTTVYTINEPVVNKAYQCYDIPVQPGDRVLVSDVKGCLDTGGAGRTWKRYLNPLGSSGDRLYHGRIWVPGATAGLVRIQSVYQKELIVNNLPVYYDDAPLRIWLGYEDQKYDDNGYPQSKRRRSTSNQRCQDLPNASVQINVTPATDAGAGAFQAFPQPSPPYDLDWDTFDANLLPLNPFWHLQRNQTPMQAGDIGADCKYFHNEHDNPKIDGVKCSQWSVDIDEGWLGSANCKLDVPRVGSLFRKLFTHGLVAGHINWAPVTYEGKIYFWDFEKFPLDRDYDMYLMLDDPYRGLTVNNIYEKKGQKIPALGLEFYSHETLSRFTDTTTWWSAFKKAVGKGNPFIGNPFGARQGEYGAAARMVDGRSAIVIGLMGIDNEHKSHTELHPVFAMAIRVDNNDPRSPEQQWAIYASNWGTEGDCSNRVNFLGHYEHQLGRDQVSFFFKAPTGSDIRVDQMKSQFFLAQNSRTDGGATTRSVSTAVPGGVVVTFFPGAPSETGKPKKDPVVYGDLWLTKK